MSTDNRQQNRRRRYLVDPRFQWRYTLTISLTVFVVSSITAAVLYGALHQQAQLRGPEPLKYSAGVTFGLFLVGIAFALVTTAGVGLWCMIVSHRICGPLSVVTRQLGQLSGGRIPRLRPLRKKDDLKGFYGAFSEAVDQLEAAKRADLAVLGHASELVEKLREGDDDADRTLQTLAGTLGSLRRQTAEALGEQVEAAGTESFSDAESLVPV